MDEKIIVVGDSIARGVSFDEGRSRYVTIKDNVVGILRGRLTATLDCYAKFGCTIDAAYNTLKTKLASLGRTEKPHYAVIEIGGNDSDFDWKAIAQDPYFDHQPKTPLPLYKETLRSMIEDVRADGIEPVLVNLPPIDATKYFNYFTGGDRKMGEAVLTWLGEIGRIYWYHERYNAALEYIGEQMNTPVINVRQAFLNDENYRKYICHDGIHPNDAGYKLMANAILEFVGRRAPSLVCV